MADLPSHALIIFGDGLMSHISEQHINLHSLAAEGCCGFLAVRRPAPDTLVQLLDQGNGDFQPLSERFMGMKAAMVTNSEAASIVGKNVGFTVSTLEQGFQSDEVRNAELMASKLVDMVGGGDQLAKEGSRFDLVLLHVTSNDKFGMSCDQTVDWIDSLVGKVKNIASKSLLLVLVFGYSDSLASREALHTPSPEMLGLRPKQSYSFKQGKFVDNVSEHHSLLVVYHQDGVTRRDHCRRLDLKEFRENCGNLTILADRFLYEVAFKLWKAPKYGA